MITLLKSKIHRAKVTEADIDYEGSITVDAGLLKTANILPYEQVDVYNITNGNRFTTYAIVAPEGSGTIGINGAAVHLAKIGDRVIICSYAGMEEKAAKAFKPRIIVLDDANRIVKKN